MSNQTYLALTIGPIYKTLNEAKRTRAVWAASYFFSWFMRNVLQQCKDEKMNIFLPDDSEIYKGEYGSGLYADRMYFIKDENTSKEKISEIINAVFKLAEKEAQEDAKKDATEEKANPLPAEFLKEYFNLHLIEKTIDKTKLGNSYALAVLNDALDNKELKQNYPFNIENNYIQEYIINKASNETFLARDAFDLNNKERIFHSIPEIATSTLRRTNQNAYNEALRKDFKDDETELIKELKEKNFKILPHHKYYAVLYADGDNISKLLAKIDAKNLQVKEFSKTLFAFGLQAEAAIAEYGGNGIYLGGEDILAFLPVACVEENNSGITHSFFNLIKRLDECFEATVIKYAKENNLPVPTLSYGIMVSYIKHPLKESMAISHELLKAAKNKPCKNTISLRFQKHSGQYTSCFIEKSKSCSLNEIYMLTELYTKQLSVENNDVAANVLSSIIQRLKDDLFFTLYYTAASQKRLNAFFENFFNEDVHAAGSVKNKFLNEVKTFSEKVINDYPEKEDCKNILFTVLRFIHFLNSKRD